MVRAAVVVYKQAHIARHVAVRPETVYKTEWPRRRIAHCYGSACSIIPLAAQFEVEPHHELPSLFVVDDLGPFHDATPRDVAVGVLNWRKGQCFITPVVEVGRRI